MHIPSGEVKRWVAAVGHCTCKCIPALSVSSTSSYFCTSTLETHIFENMDFTCFSIFEHAKSRTFALGPAITNKHWAPMAADHSARGSMKTGVKPETVCELQDTNDHRQVERKWRLPISVGELSAFEGRFTNHTFMCAMDARRLQCNIENGVVSSDDDTHALTHTHVLCQALAD